MHRPHLAVGFVLFFFILVSLAQKVHFPEEKFVFANVCLNLIRFGMESF